MNNFRFLVIALLSIVSAGACAAQSGDNQAKFYTNTRTKEMAVTVLASARTSTEPRTEKPASTVITGQVMSPFGPLAGAYIKLLDHEGSVVANSEGEFTLTVPDVPGKLRAVVSYGGFPDEPVLLPLHQKFLTVEPWEAHELEQMGVRFKNNRLVQGISAVK